MTHLRYFELTGQTLILLAGYSHSETARAGQG